MFQWQLILGSVGLVAALATGLMQEKVLVHNESIKQLFFNHKVIAWVFTWFFGGLALWYFLSKPAFYSNEGKAFAAVYTGAILLLIITAHSGGKMVYDGGAGVHPMEKHLMLEKKSLPEGNQKPKASKSMGESDL